MTTKLLTITSLFRLALVGILYSAIATSIHAATLYKWVDDDGTVRYSDRMPVTDIKKEHQMLNEQGVVIDTKAAAKTDRELAAEAAAMKVEELRLAKEKRLKIAQDKKDRVLLLTYSSEQEMNAVHGNRVEVIESVITLIEKSLNATKTRLVELEDRANKVYLSQNKGIPGGLAQNIEHFTRKVFNRMEQLQLKKEEKRAINVQFEIDLARYRLLKKP
ncbi:MAG: DUF4124 domain-containing protein [Gammaproteobacteria bacterium]|nr:DUF4124 domain-containing protein [Gammaproteobacteria bacterium]